MRTALHLTLVATIACALSAVAIPHCQIPCGIYGDKLKCEEMAQDVQTIAKSMKMIDELSKDAGKNANQIVRWVNNKEAHASKLMDTVLNYWLAQRVKLPKKTDDPEVAHAYGTKLHLLHAMIVFSMKCKQTTDVANVKALQDLLHQFHGAYFGKAAKKHIKEHHDGGKKGDGSGHK